MAELKEVVVLRLTDEMLNWGLSSAALVVRGVDNSRTPPALIAYRRTSAQRLAAYWKNRAISAHPAIREYHRTQQLVDVVDQSPAPEKLVMYIRRQRDLTASGAVIDCYNLVSAKTLLSIGAHDLGKLATPVTLRRATPDDVFVPLGQTEPQRIQGEYAYIDPLGQVVCRLEVLQCEYSKVTRSSRDIVFFLQGNRCIPSAMLLKGTWLLAEMIETFCGGKAELVDFFDAGPVEALSPSKPPITHDMFQQLELRVGTAVRAEPLLGLNALAAMTVASGSRQNEALVPSASLAEGVIGRPVVFAAGLHPLTIAGQSFTGYVLSTHSGSKSAALQVGPATLEGCRLF